MAFAQGATSFYNVVGVKRRITGTFTQGNGDTGGVFKTGLHTVEYFDCTGMKTYTVSGGTVTATTLDPGADQAGFWAAEGF